ncbi:phosphotransferase [Nocardiopsis sp. CC223A]|uniref:phosphotransferase n=1 Tax=Nocardiopsis sp. CC223A TaxID=3044051 RepID=UPI00278C3C13|nr:phosphotransferase [Nocardiopsis sp. CC223A]
MVRGSRLSVGAPTTRGTWARISWHTPSRVFSREFSGLETSMAVLGVPKPSFIQAVHWMNDGLVCRAEEMTLVHEPTVSDGYTLDKAPKLTEQWWEDLSAALERLARTNTDRVSLVQEDIDRSIHEAFGTSVDTTVSRWVIGHGDLHWANLTAPRLFLLDWDSWGLMPRGLDAAKLWESAFRVPDFAEEITERLAPDLTCRDGKLSRLWVCANRILGARRRGRATDQTEHARRAGRSLLAELS